MNAIKIFYYHRIEFSKGIDVNKTTESKECDVYHYWYFLDKPFRFQPNVCHGCNNLLMMSIILSDIAILYIRSPDYCYIISGISKSENTNLMQNADLIKKSRT